jgi:hypothetical protein
MTVKSIFKYAKESNTPLGLACQFEFRGSRELLLFFLGFGILFHWLFQRLEICLAALFLETPNKDDNNHGSIQFTAGFAADRQYGRRFF